MKVIRKPQSKDLDIVVTILSYCVEGLNPETLMVALKNHAAANQQKAITKGTLLTYSQFAGRWSCSKRHIQYLCEQGKLKTVKIGSRAIRIPESELLKFAGDPS